MSVMFKEAQELVEAANKIVVIQAENPDGDSLGSALALEDILGDMDKQVSLYCPVDIPKYLRFAKGWDRVVSDLDTTADLAIIVDTAADVLMTKVLDTPGARHFLESRPVLVIDHHTTESNLSFDHTLLSQSVISATEMVYKLAKASDWSVNAQAAENLMVGLMSDSLGLTTPSVTAESFHIAGELTELGASISVVEDRRRQFMKKTPEILEYKGRLIDRIEYSLDGKLATIHIPWKEIQSYSDQYNPSMLVIDEMRLVEGVQVAIAVKTYPDGKLTGKIKANIPVAETIAGFFGGGGHNYAAGFRVYDSLETAMPEIINATKKALDNHES